MQWKKREHNVNSARRTRQEICTSGSQNFASRILLLQKRVQGGGETTWQRARPKKYFPVAAKRTYVHVSFKARLAAYIRG
jgi:hypothetical protein